MPCELRAGRFRTSRSQHERSVGRPSFSLRISIAKAHHRLGPLSRASKVASTHSWQSDGVVEKGFSREDECYSSSLTWLCSCLQLDSSGAPRALRRCRFICAGSWRPSHTKRAGRATAGRISKNSNGGRSRGKSRCSTKASICSRRSCSSRACGRETAPSGCGHFPSTSACTSSLAWRSASFLHLSA